MLGNVARHDRRERTSERPVRLESVQNIYNLVDVRVQVFDSIAWHERVAVPGGLQARLVFFPFWNPFIAAILPIQEAKRDA